MCMPWAPCFFSSSSVSRCSLRASRSACLKRISPGERRGRGASGFPGKRNRRAIETTIVNTPSTVATSVPNALVSETRLTQKQPLPALQTSATAQLQDTTCEHGTDGISTEHAKEEHSNPLGKLSFGVPCRQCVDTTGDVARFAQAQESASQEETGLVL